MEVILNDYVQDLGEPGDKVNVAPGYARNYLVPKKLAFEATPANIRTYENNLQQRARKISKMIQEADAQKAQLESVGDLIFTRKAGEEGKLFGSVTNADVAEALKEKGYDIEKKKIALDKPIKHLGEGEAKIRIHPKVSAIVKIMVQPEVVEETEETAEGTEGAEAVEGAENAEAAEAAVEEAPAEEESGETASE